MDKPLAMFTWRQKKKTFMQYGLKWVAETSAAPEVSFAQTAICDLGGGGGILCFGHNF